MSFHKINYYVAIFMHTIGYDLYASCHKHSLQPIITIISSSHNDIPAVYVVDENNNDYFFKSIYRKVGAFLMSNFRKDGDSRWVSFPGFSVPGISPRTVLQAVLTAFSSGEAQLESG